MDYKQGAMTPMSNDLQVRDHIVELLAKGRNYRQEIIDLVSQYKYVVFYGCGEVFNMIFGTWNQYIGRKIDYCCDSNSEKWGQYFHGIKCISPDELMTIKDKSTVFVTTGNFVQVFEFLKKNGVASVNQIYKYDMGTAGFLETCPHEEVIARLCEVYKLLSDTQSVKVFNSIINRVFNPHADIDIMTNVCEGSQYFPSDIIKLTKHENFVDAGAFTGDSINAIVNQTHGEFDNIFAFELDEINFSTLQKNVQQMPERLRIKLFNYGLWNCECDISYSMENTDSSIGEGNAQGHVVPLDDVLENEKVTFIKMDIEGAEPQALRGSQNIIRMQKPALAICIYHDFKHLWEIPLYIKELVPEYKIYLRHHTNLEYETVCYAII